MEYDNAFWDKYTTKSESNYNEAFSKFVCNLGVSLKAQNVLEVGCSTGNDLRAFPNSFEVHGIDINENAITKAKQKLPSFDFQKSSIKKIPYNDSSMDLVFTHNVLNFIPESDISYALNELYRVSKKYILNFEFFNESEGIIKEKEDAGWYRDLYKRWTNYQVKIISNVDMHEDYDPQKNRFTLVKKIQ